MSIKVASKNDWTSVVVASQKNFNLPWFSGSRYLLTHVDLKALLKDIKSTIPRPPSE